MTYLDALPLQLIIRLEENEACCRHCRSLGCKIQSLELHGRTSLFKRYHETLPIDEQRRLSSKQVFTLYNEKLYGMQEYFEKPELSTKYSTAIGSFEPSISVKYGIGFGMFPSVLRSNGTERVEDLIIDNTEMKNFGCFALTEIGHGSNTQSMKTTATYEPSSKYFVLNAPKFEAVKCWQELKLNIKFTTLLIF